MAGKKKSNVQGNLKESALDDENYDALDSIPINAIIKRIKEKEKEMIASEKRIKKAKEMLMDSFTKEQKKILKNNIEERAKFESFYLDVAQKMELNLYKQSTLNKKIEMKKQQQESLKLYEEELQRKHLLEMSKAQVEGKDSSEAQVKWINEKSILAEKDIAIAREKENLDKESIKRSDKTSKEKKKLLIQEAKERKESNKQKLNEIKEQKKAFLEGKDKNNLLPSEQEALKALNNVEELLKKELDKSKENTFALELSENLTNSMSIAMGKLADKFNSAVDNAMAIQTQYRGRIDARLQGIDTTYDSISKLMKQNAAVSPYFKQTDMIKKLSELVDKGIAYNVEQRSFLATISDRLVTTFDVLDSNLMRIVRLQQADSTVARMGMEATLNKFLNSFFSDTSYLSEGFDSVSGALIEATSQLGYQQSVELEYVVQKWMGALSSLGFGTNTINTIATGINYLGTGNVSALSGNTALQNLLAMSASRSGGKSYSEMLVDGIDASSINVLLKSMVEYLKEISEDNNAVVKAAYGDVFNFTQADLKAIKNLSQSDISTIFSQSLSYSDAKTELNTQLNDYINRISIQEIISNVMDNFLYSVGEGLARNPVTNVMWQLTSIIEEATGGIHIPMIEVMGNTIDLSSFTIEGIMKTGLVGLSTLGQIGNIISSIANGGGLNLNTWGGSEVLTRGSGLSTSSGIQSSVSGSTSVASSSSSDMQKESLSSATEDSKDVSDITSAGQEQKYTMDEFYRATILDKKPMYVKDDTLNITVVGIKSKLESTISTADYDARTKLKDIYHRLSGTMPVRITNTSAMKPNINLPTTQTVKISPSDTVLKAMLATLSKNFDNSLKGKDLREFEIEESEYTLPKLIEAIMTGDVSIAVSKVPDEITTSLKNIEYELGE